MIDPASNPGFARIRAALEAMQAAVPEALAAADSVSGVETDLGAGAAALSLIALVLPPAAILADVVKIAEAVVLLNAMGLEHPGQPEDPAMARAAGH